MDRDPHAHALRLASESLAAEDPTGWFERLYAAAAEGGAVVPWDRGEPHPMLVEWTQGRALEGKEQRAMVVGCGFGADAAHLARLGFDTVGFDISETAIRAAAERFPDSGARFLTADLLDPPGGWRGAFDLVIEILTVQSLPDPPRAQAIERVAGLTAAEGTLLVIASARDERDGAIDGPPWPLTRAEIDAFASGGLETVRVEDLRDPETNRPWRWRAEYRRRG